jgi:hypothetical protein
MSLPIRVFTKVCFIVTDYPWECSFETTFAVHLKEMPAYIRSLRPCVAACVCAKLIFECCPDTSDILQKMELKYQGQFPFLAVKLHMSACHVVSVYCGEMRTAQERP